MTSSSDRLDRIEAILATVAESQERTQAQQERNTEVIARLEAAQERAHQRMGAADESADREAQYVGGALARLEAAVEGVRADIQAVVAVFAENIAAVREESQQRHDETDQRFNNLLEEARADRQEMREAREANAAEHRAFTQNVQVLLAEISRIWQRLSA